MLALIIAIIVSLEADFVQTKEVAMMAAPQVAEGHLSYHAPESIRWAYTKPSSLVWEMNGKNTNVNPQIQGLLRMIMASVKGENLQDSPDFGVQQEGNVYTLTPRKRDYKRLFRKIIITMESKKETAKRVQLFEANGNTTLIEFRNVTTQ